MSGRGAPRAASSRNPSERDLERLRQAITIRDDWLGYGLSTDPADRPAAESAITELYRLVGSGRPRFVWVESPGAAPSVTPPGQTVLRLRAATLPACAADWPLSARLASEMMWLRHRMDARIGTPYVPPWTWRAAPQVDVPERALRSGVRLSDVLGTVLRDPLRVTLRDGLGTPLRARLAAAVGGSLGLAWYGQHDAHWVAHYDTWPRLRMATFPADDARQLGLWADLGRSCGWWWPYEGLCVVSERQAVVHTELLPGGRHGERRLHNADGPAVQYTDGWSVYAWNGTQVPDWVITSPTIDRIKEENNVEVRRCAIERIGWDTYIDQAGLHLVAAVPDPGNPGCDLCLYDMPTGAWGVPNRVLLAVNGSAERDGRRRRYGLSVPASIEDPVAAAGWSYGLSGAQYAQLIRRT